VRVALVRGQSRRENVTAALESIAGQIGLNGVHRVLVKPNFVSVNRQLAATHVDAVRAVLDFVRARYDGPIVVAGADKVEHSADSMVSAITATSRWSSSTASNWWTSTPTTRCRCASMTAVCAR